MLAADVRLEGFTATDWKRVLALFRPRRVAPRGHGALAGAAARDPERARGGIIAVHAGGRVRKLVHTEVGRLRVDEAQREWPLSAEQLARRHHASWGACLELGTLDAIIDRFGARARRGDDLTAQSLLLLSLARDEMVAGRIDAWPRRLRGVPIPAASVIKGTVDSLCPSGRAMVLGLFEGGELWTCIALRRGVGGFDFILGPDEIRGDMGLLAGDWRRDYRHLSRAIEERLGPLALGCFAEASTFERLQVDPNPGAWARAVAVRDVILSPLPPALAIPLGIDAGRAAFSAMRAVAERVDPIGVVGPSLAALRRLGSDLRDRAASRASGEDSEVGRMFGFEPLELLRKLLSRER